MIAVPGDASPQSATRQLAARLWSPAAATMELSAIQRGAIERPHGEVAAVMGRVRDDVQATAP